MLVRMNEQEIINLDSTILFIGCRFSGNESH